MDYVANVPGAAAWNLIAAANPPGVAGPRIDNPAANAGQYFYFAMDGYAGVDAGGPYAGLFTTSLCGCIAGFLVRTNAGAIRRIVGYHQTNMAAVPAGAILLFNAGGGPNGPGPADVNYLIRPDKAGIVVGPPAAIAAIVGAQIPVANAHTYRREDGENVSWVISFNGDMGEMTAAFAGTCSDDQKKPWGVQAALALPPAPAGQTCCMPCLIL